MKQLFVNDITVDVVNDSITTTIHSKLNSIGTENKEDAFFVADLGDIVKKHNTWKAELPRVEPFYAVKCNEDPAALAVLKQLGTGFDCASKGEIQRILGLGISPERIIYANPCKQRSHVKFAMKNNVDMMTFDNEPELHKIKSIYPGAKCVLRFLPPDNTKAQCPLGMKYGCHPNDARHLMQVAKQLDLNVIGLSFHVGSGCWDATAYSSAVVTAASLFDVAKEEGLDFTFLDIGGGFPGHKGAQITFQEICAKLRPTLDAYFPASSGIRIIAEPGRYFVASAFTLAVNVIAKRAVQRDVLNPDEASTSVATANDEPHYMYYVNDGVYGSFNCLLYDHQEVFPSLLNAEDTDQMLYASSIWGPTCDGLDCINAKVMLPELHIGNWIIYRDMGAYTIAAASNFNGMEKPSVCYTSNEAHWVHLKAQYKKEEKEINALEAMTNLTRPPIMNEESANNRTSCLFDLPEA